MWPFRRSREPEQKRSRWTIGDPTMLSHFGWGGPSVAGVSVTETSALGLSAFYRAGAVISSAIAALPLRSLRTTSNDVREPVASWVDDPAGPDSYTPFEFVEQVIWHLFLQGDAFLMHRFNGAGALVGVHPIHPLAVGVEWDKKRPGGKLYRVTLVDGTTLDLDATTLTQVMGPSPDGLRGMSVITMARNSLGTALAGDRAAGHMLANGGMLSGLVVPDEDVDPDEARAIQVDINAGLTGHENAGAIRVLNQKLSFTPWSMNASDMQFLESRQFGVEEVARWTGVPANLLMKSDAVSTWGTGVEIVNRGLRQYTLASYTGRVEQRLSRLLPRTQHVEFDFAGLERPNPEQEIDLLIKQVDAGLLTPNEARRIRNLPPLPGGDAPRPAGQGPPAITSASPEATEEVPV